MADCKQNAKYTVSVIFVAILFNHRGSSGIPTQIKRSHTAHIYHMHICILKHFPAHFRLTSAESISEVLGV